MLDHEVRIQQNGLDLREHAVVAVQVGPAGLHHAHVGLGKVVDHLHDPVRGRDKVGVEDGDELAFGDVEALVERAGFVAVAVGAVDVLDGLAERLVAGNDVRGDFGALVGGVVEDLDFELFARVLHGADSLDEAVDDELLIEHGQLDGDAGKLVEVADGIRVVVLFVFEVLVAHRIAVNAIDGQDDHDEEVGDEQREVKPVPLVKAVEGLVRVLLGADEMAEAVVRSEQQSQRAWHIAGEI